MRTKRNRMPAFLESKTREQNKGKHYFSERKVEARAQAMLKAMEKAMEKEKTRCVDEKRREVMDEASVAGMRTAAAICESIAKTSGQVEMAKDILQVCDSHEELRARSTALDAEVARKDEALASIELMADTDPMLSDIRDIARSALGEGAGK